MLTDYIRAVDTPNHFLREAVLALYSPSALGRLYGRLKLLIMPFEEFGRYIPPRGTVIDVGCGYGYLVNFLSLESPSRRVIGLDPDRSRIAVARRTIGRRGNIHFEACDLRDLNIQADAIVMSDVLHHLPYRDHRSLLTTIYARLSPGAVFVMRDTDRRPCLKYFLFNWLSDWLFYPRSEKLRFHSKASLTTMLRDAGFTVELIAPSREQFVYVCVTFVCRKGASA